MGLFTDRTNDTSSCTSYTTANCTLRAHDGAGAVCTRPIAKIVGARRNYWTVTLPFMFIATCGMH
jgi:hypothetical protein